MHYKIPYNFRIIYIYTVSELHLNLVELYSNYKHVISYGLKIAT